MILIREIKKNIYQHIADDEEFINKIGRKNVDRLVDELTDMYEHQFNMIQHISVVTTVHSILRIIRSYATKYKAHAITDEIIDDIISQFKDYIDEYDKV